MKIRSKLVLLTSIFMIALTAGVTAAAVYSIDQDKIAELATLRQQTLDNIIEEMHQKIDMATSFIDAELNDESTAVDTQTARYVQQSAEAAAKVVAYYQGLEKKGELTRLKAQQAAVDKIRALRQQVAINGIFISNTTSPYPRIILSTEDEGLNNTLLFSELYNKDGKNVLAEAVALAKSKGEGALQLKWPVLGGEQAEEVRSAYIKYIADWDWIIGSDKVATDQRQAKLELIKNALRKMRYADGEGYFWIISDQKPFPTMIMHPHQAYEGSVLDSMRYNNLANNGTEHLFTAIVNAATKTDHGYLDTVWPKQVGAGEYTKPLPKPTYVAHIKELGWIVGTGVWADNIDNIVNQRTVEIQAHTKEIISRIIIVSAVILVLAIIASFIFSARISRALVSLTNITQAISLGGDLNTKIREVNRGDEIGDLAKSIVRLQNSVKLMMNRIKKRQTP